MNRTVLPCGASVAYGLLRAVNVDRAAIIRHGNAVLIRCAPGRQAKLLRGKSIYLPSDAGGPVTSRGVLRRVAYPVLLLLVVGVGTGVVLLGWAPSVVSPLFLLGVVGYFAVLERIIPFNPDWHPSAREWSWYGAYFVLTAMGAATAQFAVTFVVGLVAPLDPSWSAWVEIPAALLLGSLGSYIMHRLGHTNRFLWRFHGVHHVPDKVNVGNNGVNHIFDIVMAQGVVQLSLALAGFSANSVLIVGIFVTAQGYFTHANVDVRIGWFNHVLASPEQHRLHHSNNPEEAGHYGSDLAIWDHLFRSYTWVPGRTPRAIGLFDPMSFPRTESFVASLLHPIRPRRRVENRGGELRP